MINGKIHYKWSFSIAMLVHQWVMKVSQICPATAGRILRGCLACDGGVQGPSLTGTARTARRGTGPFFDHGQMSHRNRRWWVL